MSPHRTLHRLVVPLTCSLKYLSVSQLVCKSGPSGCSDVDRAFASCRLLKHTGGLRLANLELGSPVRCDQLSAIRASAYPKSSVLSHETSIAQCLYPLQAPNYRTKSVLLQTLQSQKFMGLGRIFLFSICVFITAGTITKLLLFITAGSSSQLRKLRTSPFIHIH